MWILLEHLPIDDRHEVRFHGVHGPSGLGLVEGESLQWIGWRWKIEFGQNNFTVSRRKHRRFWHRCIKVALGVSICLDRVSIEKKLVSTIKKSRSRLRNVNFVSTSPSRSKYLDRDWDLLRLIKIYQKSW